MLIHGDCFEKLNTISTASVDMIFTDPPYDGMTHNKWDKAIDLDKMWKEFSRIIKEHGVIAIWSQSPFNHRLAISNEKLYRYEWVIEKTQPGGFLNAKKMPMRCHENVLIFYKKLPPYNPQMTHGHERKVAKERPGNLARGGNYGEYGANTYDSTDRYPRDVLTFSWDKQKSALHPTQKPVKACEYFIKTYTQPGDVVLDPFMGSGSICLAAKNLGREFIGIESDDEIFRVAKERLETA